MYNITKTVLDVFVVKILSKIEIFVKIIVIISNDSLLTSYRFMNTLLYKDLSLELQNYKTIYLYHYIG